MLFRLPETTALAVGGKQRRLAALVNNRLRNPAHINIKEHICCQEFELYPLGTPQKLCFLDVVSLFTSVPLETVRK